MKRKLWRWLVYLAVAIVLLIATAILFIDTIAKSIAERRIRAQTGMETRIGKFSVGLTASTIHIENFVLKNPAEFGGGTFLEMPELYFEYDRDALRRGTLHLKVVRINVAQVHVVENKDGKNNVDGLKKHQAKTKSSEASMTASHKGEPAFAFAGIDVLDVSLNSVKFTSEKNPEQNLEQNFAFEHEKFNNLKTNLDFETAAAVLVLKAGLSGRLDFDALLRAGSKTRKKSKKNLEAVAEPLLLNSTNP